MRPGPPAPDAGVGAGLSRSRRATVLVRAERTVWWGRLGAMLLGVAITVLLDGGPGGQLWWVVAVFAVGLLVPAVATRVQLGLAGVVTLGIVTFSLDTLATWLALDAVTSDPADPVVVITVLLAVSAAVRWQLTGALVGGVVGAALAVWWMLAAHAAVGAVAPPEYLAMRGGSVVITAVLVAAMVRGIDRQRAQAQRVLELAPELVLELDALLVIRDANPAAHRLLGYGPGELVGRPYPELLAEQADEPASIDALRQAGLTSQLLERQLRHRDGQPRWHELSVQVDRGAQRLYLVGRDITLRRAAEQQLAASEQRFKVLFDANPAAVLHLGSDGVVLDANPAAGQLLGTGAVPGDGLPLRSLVAADDRAGFDAALGAALARGSARIDLTLGLSDGRLVEASAELLSIPVGTEVEGVFVALRDLTAQRQRERTLAYEARHDALTGLANRTQLHDHLEQVLAGGGPVAVLFVDLDGFKAVNDEHGHEAGDTVLVTTAQRLVTCVRDGDLVCRLAGDEFCVVLSPVDDAVTTAVTRRITSTLVTPIEVDGATVSVGASVGAAVARTGEPGPALLARADAQMYTAKRQRQLGRDEQQVRIAR